MRYGTTSKNLSLFTKKKSELLQCDGITHPAALYGVEENLIVLSKENDILLDTICHSERSEESGNIHFMSTDPSLCSG